jgi:hypothetical protein
MFVSHSVQCAALIAPYELTIPNKFQRIFILIATVIAYYLASGFGVGSAILLKVLRSV